MNIEFHYYINFLICMAAGFNQKQSYLISYSSLYVDDNLEEINIKLLDGNTSTNTHYYDPIQAMLGDDTLTLFHFLPGGKSNITMENSAVAQDILRQALLVVVRI